MPKKIKQMKKYLQMHYKHFISTYPDVRIVDLDGKTAKGKRNPVVAYFHEKNDPDYSVCVAVRRNKLRKVKL